MELQDHFVCNFISLLGVCFVLIIATFTAIQKLKKRYRTKVNCWFCNNDTKVHWEQKDWWLCPTCEQYNGFANDGDYNYDIPEQRQEVTENFTQYSQLSSEKQPLANNGLCRQCNQNEERKIMKLANFEPSNCKKYNLELKAFKESLECKYKLCKKCTKCVQGVLNEQASWLLEYKLAFFRNKPVQDIIEIGKKWEQMFRVLLSILNSLTIYDNTIWFLPIIGLLLQLGTCLASTPKRHGFDIAAAFLWIFIIILIPFKELKIIKLHLKNKWLTVDFITQYHIVVGLSFIIGLINLRFGISKGMEKQTVSLKKLELPTGKKIQKVPPIPTPKRWLFTEHDLPSKNASMQQRRSPVNMTNLLMTPVAVEVPMPINPTLFSENSGIFTNKPVMNALPQQNLPMSENYSPFGAFKFSSQFCEDKNSFDESLSTLSTLSLSDSFPKQSSKTPQIFQTKIYNNPSSDLFSKSTKSMSRKFVLSPPKLKSVTQASWVAGGYWQAGMSVPILSTSSSQSSGFGSCSSNFVPSREPSTHNDFDRYSVMSEATLPQHCHMSRPSSINSVPLCCRSHSAFLFQKPDCLMYNHFQKQTQNAPTTQIDRQSVKYSPINQDFQHQPIHENHSKETHQVPLSTVHTTVLASSIWLPILLCSSLVFNIIVLCTMLLR